MNTVNNEIPDLSGERWEKRQKAFRDTIKEDVNPITPGGGGALRAPRFVKMAVWSLNPLQM